MDVTTGDFVTPREIEYSFKLMFEDRTISILAYNLETVLAEKFDSAIFRAALQKTIEKRGTAEQMTDWRDAHEDADRHSK